MNRKVIFCGITIIGLLSILLVLGCIYITKQWRAEKLLREMGVKDISTERIRAIIKEYYDSYYKDTYSTYAAFINSIILSPESFLRGKHQLKGNNVGINYGILYLRFFVVRAYYGSELLYKNTQNYIDNSLVNDDEDITYGGRADGKNVSAALPVTIGELIKDLKENNESGHNN